MTAQTMTARSMTSDPLTHLHLVQLREGGAFQPESPFSQTRVALRSGAGHAHAGERS